MERWQNRVAVVTGAGTGIGEAIAKNLVAAGFRVVALGLCQKTLNENRDKLPKNEQMRFYPRLCDFFHEGRVRATFEYIETALGGTDILVNNAGILESGNLVEMRTLPIEEVFETNVKGLIQCTQEAFKSMRARNFKGHIIHIDSVFGHNVHQFSDSSMNIFPRSKLAVAAINDIFFNELRNLRTEIKSTRIRPGVVPEEAFDARGAILNAKDISQAVLYAISTPPDMQVHEITVKPIGEKF